MNPSYQNVQENVSIRGHRMRSFLKRQQVVPLHPRLRAAARQLPRKSEDGKQLRKREHAQEHTTRFRN